MCALASPPQSVVSRSDRQDRPALEVADLGKRFRLFGSPLDRLSHDLVGNTLDVPVDNWALRNVNFKVQPGEAYGIIGRNGSGKSTLLKIICGVMQPTEGQTITRGRVLGLLELSTGLNIELSGRQNVFASAKLLGFPDDYARDRIADIEGFADIGEFFDMPVKIYSSGMLVRLAFSLYLFMEPDILIVDEALSVGDYFFQQKCAAAINKIRARGTTMLFVSHSLGTVKAMCDRALLLERGVVRCVGGVDDVIEAYLHRHKQENGPRSIKASSCDDMDCKTVIDNNASAVDQEDRLEALFADLMPDQISVKSDAWHVVAQRFVTETGQQASLFEVGSAAQLQIILHSQIGTPLPKIGIELLDRFDRVVTGRSITLDRATRRPTGDGEAIAVLVDFQVNIFPNDYVARISVTPIGAAVAASQALSTPISVFNRHIFPPFHGIVGLPATFSIDSRTMSAEREL